MDTSITRPENDRLRVVDDEESLRSSLLRYGVKIDKIVRVKIASGEKFWCCPDCQKAYGKGHELKLHLLSVHYNIKPYQCDQPGCSWSFVTQTKLNRHKQSHSKLKSFVCNVEGCNKMFSTVYNLNAHLKLHNREYCHKCDKCSDRFQTERELQLHTGQAHKLEMSPNLPCPVQQCSKAFFNKTSLDSHIKTHSVPSNTTCNVCGKVFDRPSRLKTHMVFHTGDKPFPCDHQGCSWSFPTQSKLARHKRTHTNEKRFLCSKCDKAFGRNDHLQQHLQTHKDNVVSVTKNSSRHHVCPVLKCGKKYVTLAAYRAHLRTVHHKTESDFSTPESAPDDMSAGQLDFVALLSCVDDLQLPVPVQTVSVETEEEVVTMDTELLSAVSNVVSDSNLGTVVSIPDTNLNLGISDSSHCQDILFTDSVPPSTINLQDLE